jgi:hypothetical protein
MHPPRSPFLSLQLWLRRTILTPCFPSQTFTDHSERGQSGGCVHEELVECRLLVQKRHWWGLVGCDLGLATFDGPHTNIWGRRRYSSVVCRITHLTSTLPRGRRVSALVLSLVGNVVGTAGRGTSVVALISCLGSRC